MGNAVLWLFNDPYRIIGWGVLGLVVIEATIGVGKILHIERGRLNFIVGLMLAILPVISIFRIGTYQSGDLTHQAYFAAEFYNSLADGIALPRWAENLNFGFGNPMFIFTYPLPYYLSAGFHYLGLGYINSIKAVLIFTYLMSGWGAFIWGKRHFSLKGAVILALMYLYAPYHLIDMHFRVALGEMTALAIVPFALYFQFNWVKRPMIINLIFASACIAGLILAHQAVALITIPFIASYAFYISDKKSDKNIYKWVLPFLIGLLLAAFYWWPVITEMKYTHEPEFSQKVEFMPFIWSLISPWKGGFLWQGHNGETANVIGLAGGIAVVIAGVMLAKKRIFKHQGLLKLVLIFFIGGFFMLQEVSWPLWQILPFVKHLQFAFRWNALLIILTATIGAIVWENFKWQNKKWVLPVVVGIILLPTILNWGNRKMIGPMSDEQIVLGLPGNTLYNPYGPATPIWTDRNDPWQKNFPKNTLQVIEGKAETIQFERSSVKHDYYIWAESDTLIKENTYYFPGWQVLVDGKNTGLDPKTFEIGIIHFRVPQGNHRVRVIFQDTPVRKWAKIVSMITVLGLLFFLITATKKYSSGKIKE